MLIAHSPYTWQADVDTTVVIPALSLIYLFAVGRSGAPRWRVGCYAGVGRHKNPRHLLGAYNPSQRRRDEEVSGGQLEQLVQRVTIRIVALLTWRPKQAAD